MHFIDWKGRACVSSDYAGSLIAKMTKRASVPEAAFLGLIINSSDVAFIYIPTNHGLLRCGSGLNARSSVTRGAP